MDDRSDGDLLRDYARHGQENAFSAIVARHLAMVYHSALRQTRDSETAKDITQTVFTLLARKARRLSPRTVLAGWLVKTTSFVSAHALRNQVRRQRREEEAARMMNDSGGPNEKMAAVLPLLDQSLAELRPADRDVLSLRYLEGRDFAHIAATLGMAEPAARKRLQRALERLRLILDKRGAAIGSGHLASGLGTLSMSLPLPADLVAGTVGHLAVQQATGVAAFSLLTHSSLQIMKLIQWKTAAASLGVLVVAGMTGAIIHKTASTPEPIPVIASDPGLEDRIQRLEAENRRLSQALGASEAAQADLAKQLQQTQTQANSYKDLAEKLHAENPSAKEAYPTRRHVWAGMGRALKTLVEARDLPAKMKAMTPEQRKAKQEEMMKSAKDSFLLAQATTEIDMGGELSTPEDYTDMVGCILYGAMDLNEHQFNQVDGLLRAYYQRKGSSLQRKDIERAVAPGRTPSGGNWAGLDDDVAQSIQNILTAEQRETFHSLRNFTTTQAMRAVFDQAEKAAP